jgi:hypothetical protein
MRKFFIQKFFAKLHFGFVIFLRKNIGAKGLHKMFDEIETSGQFHQLFFFAPLELS